jgi:hypothetical protein
MFCFHMPALLQGEDLYVDTYLWPYTPFSWAEILWCAVMCLRQSRVCHGWKKVAEHRHNPIPTQTNKRIS